jgi:hypothetical protein
MHGGLASRDPVRTFMVLKLINNIKIKVMLTKHYREMQRQADVVTVKANNKEDMKVKVNITTQFQENYGSEETPHWKNKGGREIIAEINSDLTIHPITTAIVELLESLSSSRARYIYLAHDIQFVEPIIVEGPILDTLIKKHLK